jgi:hypothetical protein
MRKNLRHIAAFVLACFFLFAGTGMNIIKYCCETCSEHGIEEVAANSCSSFHHQKSSCCDSNEHHETTHDDMACSDISHQTNDCHVLRLNVDIPTIVSENHFDFNYSKLSTYVFLELFFDNQGYELTSSKLITHSPPNFALPTGREILSAKSVLII